MAFITAPATANDPSLEPFSMAYSAPTPSPPYSMAYSWGSHQSFGVQPGSSVNTTESYPPAFRPTDRNSFKSWAFNSGQCTNGQNYDHTDTYTTETALAAESEQLFMPSRFETPDIFGGPAYDVRLKSPALWDHTPFNDRSAVREGSDGVHYPYPPACGITDMPGAEQFTPGPSHVADVEPGSNASTPDTLMWVDDSQTVADALPPTANAPETHEAGQPVMCAAEADDGLGGKRSRKRKSGAAERHGLQPFEQVLDIAQSYRDLYAVDADS
ncbi:hypothetical protein CERSUDRAFT_126015 [Gelatoporia subvermispora B]|uniref:Uncharacterized protein n=1 Tax=Ceriporiopsis subvermispora (strain B) TaxID=914234 RepID=M2R6H1_CERS8|nr:hypothetical protein CERSUDRAFT_126015 [Gelatoporia subvermispora B]